MCTLLDTKPQLKDLRRLLAPLASKYEVIGNRLGVPFLGLIPLPQFDQQNLNTILEWWINKSWQWSVSWDTILKAIDSDDIGNYGVVMEVKRFINYCTL